jgi:hypothetical protein
LKNEDSNESGVQSSVGEMLSSSRLRGGSLSRESASDSVFQVRFMPRRELLTAAHRKALLALPEEQENLLQYYTLSVRN